MGGEFWIAPPKRCNEDQMSNTVYGATKRLKNPRNAMAYMPRLRVQIIMLFSKTLGKGRLDLELRVEGGLGKGIIISLSCLIKGDNFNRYTVQGSTVLSLDLGAWDESVRKPLSGGIEEMSG